MWLGWQIVPLTVSDGFAIIGDCPNYPLHSLTSAMPRF